MALAVRDISISASTFAGSWLAGQLSGHTSKAYAGDIQQFIDWMGAQDLSAVRREDVFRYRAWLVEQFAPATVNRKLSTIRQLFLEASRHGVISNNPAIGVKGHKTEGNFSPTKAPSAEQVRAMLDGLNTGTLIDIRDRAMLYLMAGMGLRREEVVNLDTGSVGEDQGYTVLSVIGKGSKRRRNRMPENVAAAVRVWLAAGNLDSEAPLFQALDKVGRKHVPSGNRMHVNAVNHIVTKRFAQFGITDCSPHSLRHFNITDLLGQGADLYKVQRWAGHADPRTTERYDRAQDDLSNSAAQFVSI